MDEGGSDEVKTKRGWFPPFLFIHPFAPHPFIYFLLFVAFR
jgi:hypothetical protein